MPSLIHALECAEPTNVSLRRQQIDKICLQFGMAKVGRGKKQIPSDFWDKRLK